MATQALTVLGSQRIYLMSVNAYAILMALSGVFALSIQTHNLYHAYKDCFGPGAHKKSAANILTARRQLVLMILGWITCFVAPFTFFDAGRPDITPVGVKVVGKFLKPLLVLSWGLYLLLIQHRYSVIIPNHPRRDIALLVVTVVITTVFLVMSLFSVIKGYFGPLWLFLSLELGYYLFAIYLIILDNIISYKILRKLLNIKKDLRTLNPSTNSPSTSNYTSPQSQTSLNPNSPTLSTTSLQSDPLMGHYYYPVDHHIRHGTLPHHTSSPPMSQIQNSNDQNTHTPQPGQTWAIEIVNPPTPQKPPFARSKSTRTTRSRTPSTTKTLTQIDRSILWLINQAVLMWTFILMDMVGLFGIGQDVSDLRCVFLAFPATVGMAALLMFFRLFTGVVRDVVASK